DNSEFRSILKFGKFTVRFNKAFTKQHYPVSTFISRTVLSRKYFFSVHRCAWISDNPFHPSHKVYDGFGAIMNQTAEMSKHKFPSWFKMMGEYYLALCPFCGSLKTWN